MQKRESPQNVPTKQNKSVSAELKNEFLCWLRIEVEVQ